VKFLHSDMTSIPRMKCRHRRPSPPADWVKRLGYQILRLNGFVNLYSQVKWIFSTKMAQHKALVLFKLNSHAKMAPDTGSQEDEES
jgi:hypothetical protein